MKPIITLIFIILIISCNNTTLENTEISFNKEDIYGEWVIESENNPLNGKTLYIYNDGKVMSNDIDFLENNSGSLTPIKDSTFLFKRAYYSVYTHLVSYDNTNGTLLLQFSEGNGNFFDSMELLLRNVSRELPNLNEFIYDGCYTTGSYVEKFIYPSEIVAKIKDNSILLYFNGDIVTYKNSEFLDLISIYGDTCCITQKPIYIGDNMQTYTAIANEIKEIDIFLLTDHNRTNNMNSLFNLVSNEDYAKFVGSNYHLLEPYECNTSIISNNFPIESGNNRIQLKCLDSNVMRAINLNGVSIDFTFKNIINGNEEKISTKIYH